MNKYAIIAAGGSGQRMGAATPKQFLEIQGRPVLWHTVHAFTEAFADMNVVVVAPAATLQEARQICSAFPRVTVVEGGSTRFQSVSKGLKMVQEESVVFVHDAVRCLVTPELIRRCYEQAVSKGSAIPSIAVNDSIRVVEGEGHKVIDRNLVRIIQTPQTFLSRILLPAFEVHDDPAFTDEATVVEASGVAVHLIEGEQTNIKITRPVDLLLSEQVLAQRSAL